MAGGTQIQCGHPRSSEPTNGEPVAEQRAGFHSDGQQVARRSAIFVALRRICEGPQACDRAHAQDGGKDRRRTTIPLPWSQEAPLSDVPGQGRRPVRSVVRIKLRHGRRDAFDATCAGELEGHDRQGIRTAGKTLKPASEQRPIEALETSLARVHLCENLCFGHARRQIREHVDTIGRLVRRPDQDFRLCSIPFHRAEAVELGDGRQAIDVDDLLEVAEHCGTAGRLVPIRPDGDEMDAFREPRRIDHLPEFAVAARRVHIVIADPDLFMAGYGFVWLPPPYRADQGNFSVGYDVYDRFDLGGPGRPTLYGTEEGLKAVARSLHRANLSLHVDFVINHNGFSNLGTPGFVTAGGYPGLAITLPNDIDGDFHSAFAGGDIKERLAGLIDIAHEKDHQFIRSPVTPGDARNIPAGTTPSFGRLANVPDLANRRFYPQIGHDTIFVFDPRTNESGIPVHGFNIENPAAGNPVVENAMGYLMRNAQWLVQVIGVDGLRIDAAKHVQGFVLNLLDRAVYRQNPRKLLDGTQSDVFTYSEVFDANPAILLPHVKKTINHADPGRIGGNRDTLDFKLYFALKENLERTGVGDAWQRIKDAALDMSDDGLHNGSAGVTFMHNHDVFKPFALE